MRITRFMYSCHGIASQCQWKQADIDQAKVIMLASALGHLLKKHSTRELGEMLGVTHTTITNWSTGKRIPDDTTSDKILGLARDAGLRVASDVATKLPHAQKKLPDPNPERGLTNE